MAITWFMALRYATAKDRLFVVTRDFILCANENGLNSSETVLAFRDLQNASDDLDAVICEMESGK